MEHVSDDDLGDCAETGLTLALAPPGSDWAAYVGGFAPLMFCDDLHATCETYAARGVEIAEPPTGLHLGASGGAQRP